MIYLLLSILSSTGIFLLFRAFPKFKVSTFPAIIINYIVAMTCGVLMLSDDFHIKDQLHEPWLQGGLIVGCLFISLFYLMAYTAQKMGVAVSSMATKMSMVIPVAWFMFSDPTDPFSWIKTIGVILALLSVVLTSGKSKDAQFQWKYLLFPLIIFVGSGIIDLVIGHYSDGQLSERNQQYLFTSAPFFTSGVLGILFLSIGAMLGKTKVNINFSTILWGAVLGLVNFASIFFLVNTFDVRLMERSAIIPINNMGIIVLSAVLAAVMFKEGFTRQKLIGVALALLSIGLVSFQSFQLFFE